MRRYTRTTATTGETKSEERSRHAATHAPVLRACLGRMRGRCRACAAPRSARKGGATAWLLAQRARDSPLQKVHCIYKSFIMNYTMVYLKWEACLVRGYMEYRDYNACREERERERNRDYNGPGIRATGRCRVGVLACVRTTTVAKAASLLSSSLLALLFLSFSLSTCESSTPRMHASTNW